MIRLYNNDTGEFLADITEEHWQFLQDHLEAESSTDQDYYIDQATLDLFEQAGADSTLLSILRQAIGSQEGIEIRWSRA
ncbi:MAG TPA: galactosyldiacylglycerol synthase [Alphaproteobacteria bacterium]|nr:galactosyldiacylglycerol synthase [Alphaproteobacteria bacterium]